MLEKIIGWLTVWIFFMIAIIMTIGAVKIANLPTVEKSNGAMKEERALR